MSGEPEITVKLVRIFFGLTKCRVKLELATVPVNRGNSIGLNGQFS